MGEFWYFKSYEEFLEEKDNNLYEDFDNLMKEGEDNE